MLVICHVGDYLFVFGGLMDAADDKYHWHITGTSLARF
jgi:hypothetical protein